MDRLCIDCEDALVVRDWVKKDCGPRCPRCAADWRAGEREKIDKRAVNRQAAAFHTRYALGR
ncbi:MAG: hypothetical protein ACYTAN_10390 [Planctomycetota bacterium]|jgi:Zn-finger nucleic acid-binding protein